MSKPATSLRVLKFGGTSLGSADRIMSVSRIIRDEANRSSLVVVVSAMGTTTDILVGAVQLAASKLATDWRRRLEDLEQEHLFTATVVASASGLAPLQSWIQVQMSTVRQLCQAVELRGESRPQDLDAISSVGEIMSAKLVAAALEAHGVKALSVDSARLLTTDDHFGNATPWLEPSRHSVHKILAPLLAAGVLPVVSGYRAATADGRCTTLGRGGSDYSATILGALLAADEVWIWTDVDGLMTADPRLVPGARVLAEISYREAIELAFFGAKVLHPNSIELPMRYELPVRIRNTFAPDRPGTVIGPRSRGTPGVRAVAHTADALLLTVGGRDGVSFARVATTVLRILEAERVPTLMVTQSSAENVICFAVAGAYGEMLVARLEQLRTSDPVGSGLGSITVTPRVGVVVAVGEGMKGTPGIAARLFGALAERHINVVAIAQGSSELSVSAAVLVHDLAAAVAAIHCEFDL